MAISVVLAQLGAPCAVNAQAIPGAKAESTKALVQGEWLAYAGTHASARYSPVDTDRPRQRQGFALRLALESPEGRPFREVLDNQ
jgi:hypothetical protein